MSFGRETIVLRIHLAGLRLLIPNIACHIAIPSLNLTTRPRRFYFENILVQTQASFFFVLPVHLLQPITKHRLIS